MSARNCLDFHYPETCSEVHSLFTRYDRFTASKIIINVGRHGARRLARTSFDTVRARIVIGDAKGQPNFLFAITLIRKMFVKGA